MRLVRRAPNLPRDRTLLTPLERDLAKRETRRAGGGCRLELVQVRARPALDADHQYSRTAARAELANSRGSNCRIRTESHAQEHSACGQRLRNAVGQHTRAPSTAAHT